jgi:hypothetical protein
LSSATSHFEKKRALHRFGLTILQSSTKSNRKQQHKHQKQTKTITMASIKSIFMFLLAALFALAAAGQQDVVEQESNSMLRVRVLVVVDDEGRR